MGKVKKSPRGAKGRTPSSNFLRPNKEHLKPRVKRVSWRDEVKGVSVAESEALTETTELTDPAILAVQISKIRYSREQLMGLRDVPLSRRKPDFLEDAEVPVSILDPEKCNLDRKKSDTPTDNGPKTGLETLDQKGQRGRSTGDARERIRKENDGIVLSPQRRSFNTGCFVPVNRPNRAHSPLGGPKEPAHIGVRKIQPASRRIGSGRIMRASDWGDYGDKPAAELSESLPNDYGFQRQSSATSTNASTDDKFGERRSFGGRDFGDKHDKDSRRNGGGNGSGRFDRRRMDSGRDEEPEWFSSGPISQNDTIELRGFEDSDKPSNRMKRSTKRAKEWAKKKVDGGPGSSEEPNKPAQQQQGRNSPAADQGSGGDQKKSLEESHIFDDIFKSDNISLLAQNGIGADGDNKKSRFASWFKQESPEKQQQQQQQPSRRSSTQDDNDILRQIMKEFDEVPNNAPGDSKSYFAPISPANNTLKHNQANKGGAVNIMEVLQRGQQQQQQQQMNPMSGKIMKLDELEAKIRQSSGDLPPQMKPQQLKDDEMVAFKRLLAQVNDGHAVSAANNGPMPKASGPPMSLMEMLKHAQQQDEARMHHNQHTLKLQQQKQQMEMLSKLMSHQQQQQQLRGASPLQDLGMQQSRELLNRPEAQAILHGLNCGDLTPQHIYQQLSNPGLQPRHKEMLTTILKCSGQGGGGIGPSPRVLSPVPPMPHHMFPGQQQQQLRVSPLPPNAMHQRIPSPRELQIHTQNILQKALIKKKLEEQTENYRKKQEQQQQRGQSPSTAKSISSPTPLAFTPTSVLRKMTADKDEGKENKIDGKLPQGRPLTGMRPAVQQQAPPQVQQWNHQQFASLKQPAGRPIVKANANFQQQQQPNAAEQFFNQHRLFKQSQQQQQQQQYMPNQAGLSSHHNMSPYSGPNSQSSSFSTQHHLTQHQLRAQHQQRAPPSNPQPNQQQPQQQQMAYQQQQPQGNQQQTWQQFLANAQQSNRNNSIGRSATMDGDLSPTTNQLARWFSPDLLERARGGELPSTATLAQQVLSLEEIERQTAPPVHN